MISRNILRILKREKDNRIIQILYNIKKEGFSSNDQKPSGFERFQRKVPLQQNQNDATSNKSQLDDGLKDFQKQIEFLSSEINKIQTKIDQDKNKLPEQELKELQGLLDVILKKFNQQQIQKVDVEFFNQIQKNSDKIKQLNQENLSSKNNQKPLTGFDKFKRLNKQQPKYSFDQNTKNQDILQQMQMEFDKQKQKYSQQDQNYQEQKNEKKSENQDQNPLQNKDISNKSQEFQQHQAKKQQDYQKFQDEKNLKISNEKDEKNEKQEKISNEKQEKISNEKDEKFSDEKEESQEQQKSKSFKPQPQKSQYSQFMYMIMGALIYTIGKPFLDQILEYNYISYQEFIENYLENEQIESITLCRNNDGKHFQCLARIKTQKGPYKYLVVGNPDSFLENLEKFQLQRNRSKMIPIQFENNTDSGIVFDRIINIGMVAGSAFILFMFLKQTKQAFGGKNGTDGIFSIGKSKIKVFGVENKIGTKFKDVAGLDEAKNEIQEFVDFLQKPKKYQDLGARIPRGALLSGPPGTGKTLLAKACAGEAGVPFFYLSGSEFVEMFVGVGASRVRDLFKQAKEKSPSIIFIDEIDAIGRKRESKMGGNDERDNTLNQLLVELDGFGTNQSIVVMGATNRLELLDPALTRPGRFDRTIEVQLPSIEGREQIFKVHLKSIKLSQEKTLEDFAKRLSTLTPGFSGADIANLCNEAAILAARNNKQYVETIDFEMASERVIAGYEKKTIISENEKKTVAYHESGHAVVSWFLEGGSPLLKLTIIPRSKGALGFAQYLPNEEGLETREALFDRLCVILGGRCSEEFFFKKITTGASDDLQKAYKLANALVTKYGMRFIDQLNKSDKIGYLGFKEPEITYQYSEDTQKLIDMEIKCLIDHATRITRETIIKYQDQIKNLAEKLVEKETLDLTQIVQVIGERPYNPKDNFKAYLDTKKEIDIELQQKKSNEHQQLQQ